MMPVHPATRFGTLLSRNAPFISKDEVDAQIRERIAAQFGELQRREVWFFSAPDAATA
jgi:hypothetical protein